jgi:hypothetical protein
MVLALILWALLWTIMLAARAGGASPAVRRFLSSKWTMIGTPVVGLAIFVAYFHPPHSPPIPCDLLNERD